MDKEHADNNIVNNGVDNVAKTVQKITSAPYGMQTPREHPRGISLIKHSKDILIFRVKAAHRRLRWLPVGIAVVGLPIAIALGGIGGINEGGWVNGRHINPYFSFWPMIICCLIVLGIAIVLWRELWPDLKFEITPTEIKVANLIYDRKHFGGMRIGYEIDSKSEGVKLGFVDAINGDHSLGFTGLRIQYGRWGDDLDYMVNKYHAAEYVVWMNEMIATVGAPEAKEHEPSKGRKKAEF